MLRRSQQVLACPECGQPFSRSLFSSDPVDAGTLVCESEHQFDIQAGMPMLVRESARDRVKRFAANFSQAWTRAGWGGLDLEDLVGLPYLSRGARHTADWQVKARSMEALWNVLEPRERPRVVDLGCGVGWLAHAMARRGHEVYATDILLDAGLGLGAATTFVRLGPSFERVWGELERPPFLPASVDAVVCNAALHYAQDLRAALAEIQRILKPGGILVVMNSPVYVEPESARRALEDFRGHLRTLGASAEVTAAYHHFVAAELQDALATEIGMIDVAAFDPGRWFRLSRKMKGFLLGMELASFPILVANKPSEDSGRAR